MAAEGGGGAAPGQSREAAEAAGPSAPHLDRRVSAGAGKNCLRNEDPPFFEI